MERRCPLLSIICFLTVLSVQLAISHASTTVLCQEAERQALIQFKRGFYDPSGRLSSWVGKECCMWEGVGCSNVTGRVIKLDLRNARVNLFSDCSDNFDYWYGDSKGCKWTLYGDISPSLLSLPHLQHLDLSGNVFERRRIPEFLGSLRRLRYLNLSSVGVAGRVPERLGNLSTLRHLDLSYNFYGLLKLYVEDPGWLSRLTSLRLLNMSWVSFRNASNWLQAFNALPHIQAVELKSCDLGTFPPSLPLVNFTSLTTLDLGYNNINSTIPDWLFNITSLDFLYLGGNDLNWLIPESIAKLTSLKALDLSQNTFHDGFIPAALSSLCRLQFLYLIDVPINDTLANLEVIFSGCLMSSLQELYLRHSQLSGTLPDWLGNMENLKSLDLSSNFLYGSLPASLGNLSMLQTLDVSSNDLNGSIPDGIGQMKSLVSLFLTDNSLRLSQVHLANLSNLKDLDISYNSFVLEEGNDWIPPFKLNTLSMQLCEIVPRPQFPKWLRTQTALTYLDLAGAGIQGAIPNWLPPSLEQLDLSYNGITGGMPQYLPNLSFLGLSNNRVSGPLPSTIADTMPAIQFLYLSTNNLSGILPLSLCRNKFLYVLRLAQNNLSGDLPNCWKNSSILVVMDLSNNTLQGGIPHSICNLKKLQSLHLSNNNLSGQMPLCLKSLTELETLDLGYNSFVGDVPPGIGENLLNLKTLSLRSNAFTGSIPRFSHIASLQILDLSNNNLSGTIPRSFGNFPAMKLSPQKGDYDIGGAAENMWLFVKGIESEYSSLLPLVTMIDLSNNGLSGSIPEELGNLQSLQTLNLSWNYLTGEIPNNIKGMQQLETLDLSRNNLSGSIPSTLATLNFLNHLNLSYNNLSGRIPTGNQLQTFTDPSIYAGNPNLCGPPLTKSCPKDISIDDKEKQSEDLDSRTETVWEYASITLGFIVGFWTICGTLLLQWRWRIAYFRAIDNMSDRLYVVTVLNMAKLRRKLRGSGQDG
ncbi:unnamed protein product [Musa acuminata subsp. malaccensis]|uniref:(wild Malaysian banana) hypothetical protein n=1 Tax=Musa acuminata subsp. malaccensis TaxID=214687 RepID=A0A804I233_MUSAM|nr:PREDICTED: LRR receptor-like serine/threonine-protein kinase GSO1 [Musa acuminata subsp. malaccensis]CAG1861864.1 unnamed protein product [Musa acuminata subsp. malaccensis]